MGICEKATLQAIKSDNWRLPESLLNILDPCKIWVELDRCHKELMVLGKHELGDVVQLVSLVSHMILNLNGADPVFKKEGNQVEQVFRSAGISDFSTEHIGVLEELAKTTENLFLSARFHDLLWLSKRPRDVVNAESAISKYLALTLGCLEDSSLLSSTKNYSLRAINLWRQLGYKDETRASIQKVLLECIKTTNTDRIGITRHLLANLSQCFDPDKAVLFIKTTDNYVEYCMNEKQFELARRLLDVKRSFSPKADVEKINLEEAQTYVSEVEMYRDLGEHPSRLKSALNKAIHFLKDIPSMRPDLTSLKKEMIEVQKRIPATLKTVELESVNLKDDILGILQYMGQHSTQKCIRLVGSRMIPESKEALYKRAETSIGVTGVSGLFTQDLIDEKGKTIGRRRGLGVSEQEKIAAYRADAIFYLKCRISIEGTFLNHMRREICNRLDAGEDVFDFLIYPNPFVPESRIYQYRNGLNRGLAGDWISCIYILVPQIENSIRTILQSNGFDVISIDHDGIQKEKDLNALIYTEGMEQTFGKDMTFLLQVILTDSIGFNLRNRIAHGLVTDGEAYSYLGPTIWSLAILLCSGILNATSVDEDEGAVVLKVED